MFKSASWTCLVFGILFIYAPTVEAATLYMQPNEFDIYPGDTRSVEVRLDTDDSECVNVVSGVINYDPNVVLVDVSRGNSIVPFWVEEPTIDKVNHQVTFAGGIPNGYCGRIVGDPRLTNVIFELIFQAPGFSVGGGDSSPLVNVSFGDATQVLLNDGMGTPAPLQTFGATMLVGKKPQATPVDDWSDRVAADTIAPQSFAITLSDDKSIYGGRYFITFNTTDKQSGLDHYEIMEEPLDDFDLFSWGGVDAPWLPARSPYLLKDQTLNSTIRVKAVDKAGNEYIAVLVPEEKLRGHTQRDYVGAGLLISGVIIVIVSLLAFFYYRRTVHKLAAKNDEDEIE